MFDGVKKAFAAESTVFFSTSPTACTVRVRLENTVVVHMTLLNFKASSYSSFLCDKSVFNQENRAQHTLPSQLVGGTHKITGTVPMLDEDFLILTDCRTTVLDFLLTQRCLNFFFMHSCKTDILPIRERQSASEKIWHFLNV